MEIMNSFTERKNNLKGSAITTGPFIFLLFAKFTQCIMRERYNRKGDYDVVCTCACSGNKKCGKHWG